MILSYLGDNSHTSDENNPTIGTHTPENTTSRNADRDSLSSRDSGLVITPDSSPKPCESPQATSVPSTGQVKSLNSPKVKRVAFTDDHSKPMIIQRSFSVSDGERVNGMYSPPSMNPALQRTQSVSRGKPIQAVSAYIRGPHVPSHNSYDHRLPRVHRNLAYETAVPPPPIIYRNSLHHSSVHHPPNSAFRMVQPSVHHPADYRNQPRYSSLPLRNQRSMMQGVDGGILLLILYYYCLIVTFLGRWRLKNLNRAGLMSLLSDISLPEVDIRKLE